MINIINLLTNSQIAIPYDCTLVIRIIFFQLQHFGNLNQVRLYNAYDGDLFEYRLPDCRQCSLPKPSRSAVSVHKGGNKLKFIMEYARTNEHLRLA